MDEATYFLTDHLRNTRVSYMAAPTVGPYIINAVDYYPYGKILREYDNGDGDRYLTTQHERDKETGLDYRGARYYDSDVARFLSLDPLAAKYPDFSPYNYVVGNPIKLVDIDGKAPGDPEKIKKSDPSRISGGYFGVDRKQIGGTPIKLNTDFKYIQPTSGSKFKVDEASSFSHLSYTFADNNKNLNFSLGFFRNHTKGDFVFNEGNIHWSVGNSQAGAVGGVEGVTPSFKGFTASASLFFGVGPQFSKYTADNTTVSNSGWGIRGFGEVLALSANITTPKIGGIFSATFSVFGVFHQANFGKFSATRTASDGTTTQTEYSKLRFSTLSNGITPTLQLNFSLGRR